MAPVAPPAPVTLDRAQRGDAGAQAEILQAHAPSLRYLVRRLGGPGEPEDLLQDLYAKLLVALPRFEPGGAASLATWVVTVAHHWLLERRRKRSLVLVPLDGADAVADPAPDAEAQVSRRQQHAALQDAIDALEEPFKRTLVLALVHQQPLEAIARTEGVPLGTVKSRLHRARAALALRLGAHLDDHGDRHAHP